MASLEKGQRAYEAYAAALRSKSFFITPWEKLEGCSRYGFAAVEQACAVPAATQADSWKETAEQWRRAALAWQEWATPLCQGHPDGGLAGDGPMRDELTARLREAGKAQTEWLSAAEWPLEPGDTRLMAVEILRNGVPDWDVFVGTVSEEYEDEWSSDTDDPGWPPSDVGYSMSIAELPKLKAPSAPEGA